METIADRLRNRRLELKMSQDDLAKASGLSQSTIAHIESGRNKGTKHAVPLADALQVEVRWLTQGTLRVVRAQTRDSAENLPLIFDSASGKHPHNSDQSAESKTKNVPPDIEYLDEELNFRPIPVIGRAQGGMPERIWTDGDYPVGATDKYAMVATSDHHAFLTPIVGTSMVPKFNPGDYAFVEPETPVEIEDDVLVRLATGETMLKRLISRRGGIQLASYNEPGTMLFAPEEITWMYYVAHYIPARKIKDRV